MELTKTNQDSAFIDTIDTFVAQHERTEKFRMALREKGAKNIDTFLTSIPTPRELFFLEPCKCPTKEQRVQNALAFSATIPANQEILLEVELVSPVPLIATTDAITTRQSYDWGDAAYLLERCHMAAYLADHACYPKNSDKVEFERLAEVMSSFPQGFRVAYMITKDPIKEITHCIPLGYTGWFPISNALFDCLAAGELENRRIIRPATEAERNGKDGDTLPIFHFNYSVLPECRGTSVSKRLMTLFQLDLPKNTRGAASITVSSDGAKQATRYEMTERGIIGDGSGEKIWAARY